jgi:hypothetical protein
MTEMQAYVTSDLYGILTLVEYVLFLLGLCRDNKC